MTSTSRAQRPKYQSRYDELIAAIALFEQIISPLPGITGSEERSVFVNQLIDSERRNGYFKQLVSRQVASEAADPRHTEFNPLKAALHHWRTGSPEEAFWLVFQFVHFGKHPIAGWRYVREVYGRLGVDPIWSWTEISSNTPEFRLWLGENQEELRRKDQRQGFGNHRKYASLRHDSARGTASVFESYVEWVMSYGNHATLFATHTEGVSPEVGFEAVYNDMDVVVDFGRIAKFDYLMTLSRLGFVKIQPGHPYLEKSTGPLQGAKLLLDGPESVATARELRPRLEEFTKVVGVTPDVIEDAVCNWQKSPGQFKAFVL